MGKLHVVRGSSASTREGLPHSASTTTTSRLTVDPRAQVLVHLLDVGQEKYGDCIFCQFGAVTVLVDGAHPGDYEGSEEFPSIPDQLKELLGTESIHVTLLVVTHCHSDHIGCLPALVERGVLTADWALLADANLGWGRASDAPVPDPSSPVNRLQAALREESRADDDDDERLRRFLDSAANLEQKYRGMIETLKAKNTKVVRHGRENTHQLLEEFAGIGMKILGPSTEQLTRCANVIQELGRSASDAIATARATDVEADEVKLYREMAPRLAAVDAGDSVGAAVNDQSITLVFEVGGRKVLLTGDMQLASPGVTRLTESMGQLRQAIAVGAPYAFVKLAHHGAKNGLNESVFETFGDTKNFGISTGQAGLDHPNLAVLTLLEQANDDSPIRVGRTDRNGQVTVSLSPGQVRVRKQRGEFNDWAPKGSDRPTDETPLAAARTPIVPIAAAPATSGVPNVVEVITRVPHTTTRVTVTIDVEPRPLAVTPARPPSLPPKPPLPRPALPVRPAERAAPLRIAGGRALPPLFFVTNRTALEDNLGREETSRLLSALRERHEVLDTLPNSLLSSQPQIDAVRGKLANLPDVRGVVLLGGYDVVPSRRLDVLPPSLRQRVRASSFQDLDDFIVWSDAAYGERGAGWPPLPVSRIPDGNSSHLMFAAVQAANRSFGGRRAGIRNVERPFANVIFNALAGNGNLLVSGPTIYNQSPQLDLASDRLYIMLHGDFSDATRFRGERTVGGLEAMNLGNVPAACGAVVFAGCCWGALIVATMARYAVPGQPIGPRSADSSLALRFLLGGATAFIGSTGAHYSPVDHPYQSASGPMHAAFWRHYDAGIAPAQALQNAKFDYLRDFPHGQTDAASQAIELKTLQQFTCLGLGW
jgi:beta-lactamase superfamily II metal-dependent hydrolase